MPEGQTLVSFIWPAQNPDLLQQLSAKKTTVLTRESPYPHAARRTARRLSSLKNVSAIAR